MNTILLATDGSPSARNATTYAIDLAAETGWKLSVLSVWSMAPPLVVHAPTATLERIRRTEREHAENVVGDAVAEARVHGVDAHGESVYGNPVDVISAAAEDARMLIVGSHGWGAMKRLVFGSVSLGLLHTAPCPVLVVRGVAAAREEPAALASA